MVIVLIRRCVKKDREKEFLAKYKGDKPDHPGFIDETLTRLDSADSLPESMRSLPISCGGDCVTYLNIARWQSAEAFREHFKPKTMHDPEIECSDRYRAVFEIIDAAT